MTETKRFNVNLATDTCLTKSTSLGALLVRGVVQMRFNNHMEFSFAARNAATLVLWYPLEETGMCTLAMLLILKR